MTTVTAVAKNAKQPRGGYLNIRDFTVTELDDWKELNEDESISPALVGIVVDYLTRLMSGDPVKEAFEISLIGAHNMITLGAVEAGFVKGLLRNIKGIDNISIVNACKLASFDTAYRRGPEFYTPVEDLDVELDTVENIRLMVRRAHSFLNDYGPITKNGFTMDGGYTEKVVNGDGDFMTKHTLWDMKVIKGEPNKNHTLQLLMYYLMGKRSIHPEFKTIKNLGIFNPRLNKVYEYKISDIPDSTIETVSKNVIGY